MIKKIIDRSFTILSILDSIQQSKGSSNKVHGVQEKLFFLNEKVPPLPGPNDRLEEMCTTVDCYWLTILWRPIAAHCPPKGGEQIFRLLRSQLFFLFVKKSRS